MVPVVPLAGRRPGGSGPGPGTRSRGVPDLTEAGMIPAFLRRLLAQPPSCPCGQVDGGPWGYREHWCRAGCPVHGPCTHGACPYQENDS